MKYLSLVLVGMFMLVAGSNADNQTILLQQRLATVFPAELVPNNFQQAELPGFYEAEINGRVFYISSDGRYLINGEVLDLQQQRNITKTRLQRQRKELLGSLDEADMIIYSPQEYRYTITVFTDIDCGYCRKLHSQIHEYNAMGIRVRYLAYPRSGKDTPSYYKAVSVWCAADRQQALTQAKNGQLPPFHSCDHPVDRHLQLGERFGVKGTPAIILDDGELVPGYVPPVDLLRMLQARRPKA